MNENEQVNFESEEWGVFDFSDLQDVPDTEEAGNENAAEETEETTDATEEANPADEVTEDGAEESTPTQETQADQLYDLKVLGEDRKLTLDEMKAAAQKGLDYDRVKAKNSELQKEREANAPLVELVKELADAQGISTEQLITNVRAAALAKKEGISIAEATSKVQLQARENAVSKREAAFKAQDEAQKDEAAKKEARTREFAQFFQKHPGVKPADIPQQCFTDMSNGIKLEVSYANLMNQKKVEEYSKTVSEKDARIKALEEKLAAMDKQKSASDKNRLNATRSVGSADTAGKASKEDLWDQLWNDGT